MDIILPSTVPISQSAFICGYSDPDSSFRSVGHAGINGNLRLAKRCGERILCNAPHERRHETPREYRG
jgi:hypothetical protein